jgi:D-threo-aldose 1-dehydrogenase
MGDTAVNLRVGFGCSRLHYLATSRERQALLAAAYDLGIRHFDAAPSYGHGLAELELGTFVKYREGITVATKYGRPASVWVAPIVAVSRRLARPAIAVRSIARRLVPLHSVQPEITRQGLEQSVLASLRRLGLGRIDIHFLHEPTLTRISDLSGVIETYASLQRQGLIAKWGLAGDFLSCKEICHAAGRSDIVIQTNEHQWDTSLIPEIVHGVISDSSQSFSSVSVRTESLVQQRVRSALARRPQGSILVSTTNIEHLRQVVTAVRYPSQA